MHLRDDCPAAVLDALKEPGLPQRPVTVEPLREDLAGQVAQLGIASLVSFIAVLSVNLGLINLFPIPVLDGGHLVFYLAEEKGYDVVVDTTNTIYFKAALDITAEALAAFNKAYPTSK